MKPFKLLIPAPRWHRISLGLSAALLALLFTSCGERNSTSNHSASLTISVPQPQAAKEHAAKINALPNTVTRIDVSVTTATQVLASGDILTMGGEITVGVPAGVALTVSSVAYDANSTAIYQGSATVAALTAGERSTVSVTLNPITLAYLADDALMAVDPTNPTASPAIVESSGLVSDEMGTSVRTLYAASFNATAQTLSDNHTYARIYIKNDGKLYKVTAANGTGLAPAQVSNESLAAVICAVDFVAIDYANVNNSQYGYSLPNGSGSCGGFDTGYKMVRLGMSATDIPIAAKPRISTLTDSSTGALIGHLVLETSQQTITTLSRCDASFLNCAPLFTPVISGFAINLNVKNLGFDRQLLEIDSNLYLYTVSTNTLSKALFPTANNPITGLTSDASTIYFTSNSAIYALPADGSTPVSAPLLTESAATFPLGTPYLTTNKLVYLMQDSGNFYIKAVAKSGGASSPLITLKVSSLAINFTSGTHIYYQLLSGGISTIGIVEDDGSNQETIANAQWVGQTDPASFSVAPGAPAVFENIFLAQNYTLGNIGGGTLSSYRAASRSLIALLGTVPADITASLLCFGNTVSAALCTGPSGSGQTGGGLGEIFFVNSLTANSLTRVTETSAIDETPVF